MKKICSIILIVITSLAIQVHADDSMYWPAPPPAAKIQLIETFSTEKDFPKSPRPWYQNLFNVVLGLKQENRLIGPYGIGGSKDKLYITDPGARTIWLVDAKKQSLQEWVSAYDLPELQQPIDVVVGSDDRVYVSDSSAQKVFVFGPKGKLDHYFEGFERPTGLAIDRSNNILFVSDTIAHVVQVISLQTGKVIQVLGERGEGSGDFNFPVHLAYKDGKLYVVDSMNFRVQVFDRNYQQVAQFGQIGDGFGDFSRPKGISVDSDGNIYVVDGLTDRVQIFNLTGDLLLAFGRTGTRPGEFWLASDIFIDEDDRIYVADTYNHRVQVFQYLGE